MAMPEVELDDVKIAYEVAGTGEPIVLVCGCGQPAVAWQVGVAPALVAAGYQVVTFENRGIAPSSSPPAPYSVDDLVGDTLGLLDHLGLDQPRLAGHSMGGWVAETMAAQHPDRVRAAAFMGSCNVATAWEKAITTVERDLARLDVDLPPLFYACETLRYLPNKELQDSELVATWLSLIADQPPPANPGRLGQFEACLAWSLDLERTVPRARVRTRHRLTARVRACSRRADSGRPLRRDPRRESSRHLHAPDRGRGRARRLLLRSLTLVAVEVREQ
jgi:pimeloyl-ACP methyl ester carboxylesterase